MWMCPWRYRVLYIRVTITCSHPLTLLYLPTRIAVGVGRDGLVWSGTVSYQLLSFALQLPCLVLFVSVNLIYRRRTSYMIYMYVSKSRCFVTHRRDVDGPSQVGPSVHPSYLSFEDTSFFLLFSSFHPEAWGVVVVAVFLFFLPFLFFFSFFFFVLWWLCGRWREWIWNRWFASGLAGLLGGSIVGTVHTCTLE